MKSFDELERERRDALSSQDAMKYSRLCSQLGVEPEDEILYFSGVERREGHKEVGTRIAKQLSRQQKLENTAQSLREAFKYGGSPYELTSWVRDCFDENEVRVVDYEGKKVPIAKMDDAILATYALRLVSQG